MPAQPVIAQASGDRDLTAGADEHQERDASTIALPLTRSKRLTALILVDDMSSMLTTGCLHAGDISHPR